MRITARSRPIVKAQTRHASPLVLLARCPVCNRIRFTYRQLKECCKRHGLLGMRVKYTDRTTLVSYSWSGEPTGNIIDRI